MNRSMNKDMNRSMNKDTNKNMNRFMRKNIISFMAIMLFLIILQGCGRATAEYAYIDKKDAEIVSLLSVGGKVFVEGELTDVGDRYSDNQPYPYIRVKDGKGCEWVEVVNVPGPYTTEVFEEFIGWKVKVYGKLSFEEKYMLYSDTNVERNKTILENVDDRFHMQIYYDVRDMLVKPEKLDEWYQANSIEEEEANNESSKVEGIYYSDAVVEEIKVEEGTVTMALRHKKESAEEYYTTVEELDPFGIYSGYDKNSWRGKFKKGDGIRLYYVVDRSYSPIATPVYISSVGKPFTLERSHGYYTEMDEIIADKWSERGTRFIVKKNIKSSKRKVVVISENSSKNDACAEILCLKKLLKEQGFDDYEFITDYWENGNYLYIDETIGTIEDVRVDYVGYVTWSDLDANEDIIVDYLIKGSDNMEFIRSVNIGITDEIEENAKIVFALFMNSYNKIK